MYALPEDDADHRVVRQRREEQLDLRRDARGERGRGLPEAHESAENLRRRSPFVAKILAASPS